MSVLSYALRERARSGHLVGTFVGLSAPAAVEVLGSSGFEILCLDAEHSALGAADLQGLIRAADVTRTPAIVRVPELGPDLGVVLDSGAAGVVVPRVETAGQAREAVSRVRYPPVGTRGAGPGRVTGYGADLVEYIDKANDAVLLVLQIETWEGVQNVEEIAAVEGVDVIFVGPGDLAVSLGTTPGSEAHADAITRVLDVAASSGVRTGIFCSTPAQVEQYAARGVSFFLVSADVSFLGEAAQKTFRSARAAAAGAALVSGNGALK